MISKYKDLDTLISLSTTAAEYGLELDPPLYVSGQNYQGRLHFSECAGVPASMFNAKKLKDVIEASGIWCSKCVHLYAPYGKKDILEGAPTEDSDAFYLGQIDKFLQALKEFQSDQETARDYKECKEDLLWCQVLLGERLFSPNEAFSMVKLEAEKRESEALAEIRANHLEEATEDLKALWKNSA